MRNSTIHKGRRSKKDRAVDLLREMDLLQAQSGKDGSVNLDRLPPMKEVRRVAKKLVNSAGLNYSANDIAIFLYLVDKHLHGEFSPGAHRKIPYDDFTLLQVVYRVALDAKLTKLGQITSALHADDHFSRFSKDALHNLLVRALAKATMGAIDVPKPKVAHLRRMLPVLAAVQASIKPRRRLK